MPEINKKEPGGHPKIESRAIHIPVDSDFGTGTSTTVFAPYALGEGEAFDSLIMVPPDFEITIAVDPTRWQVEVLLGPSFSSLPSDARMFLLPDSPGAIALAEAHAIRVEFNRGNITAAFLDDISLSPKQGRS